MARSTFTDLNPDEYNQRLCYYPFMFNLGHCNRSCNAFDDSSCRICVSNKVENININVFKVITKAN